MPLFNMTQGETIQFGPDKSEIVRGWAILFMICLHNYAGGAFKICVPIFTFLVGYGYSFAKRKDWRHAVKRSWHLLSHFWLILLGIFLPVEIWNGYEPTLGNVLSNMFGLDSNLNWYSWYIYFYLYAMVAMIGCSRLIDRLGLKMMTGLIICCFVFIGIIHIIPQWTENIWLQAIHDCFLCTPTMLVGYYLASNNTVSKISIPHNWVFAICCIAILLTVFLLRKIPYVSMLDFILVPIFVVALVALFNIIRVRILVGTLAALGKESMNMWFIHALFATTGTALTFAPLIKWIEPKILLITMMVIGSYFASKIVTFIYSILSLPPTKMGVEKYGQS